MISITNIMYEHRCIFPFLNGNPPKSSYKDGALKYPNTTLLRSDCKGKRLNIKPVSFTWFEQKLGNKKLAVHQTLYSRELPHLHNRSSTNVRPWLRRVRTHTVGDHGKAGSLLQQGCRTMSVQSWSAFMLFRQYNHELLRWFSSRINT